MGHFNYRVFKEQEIIGNDLEDVFTIRQVGYDDEDKPLNYTDPYWPIGITIEELQENIKQMQLSFEKPILTIKDFE